MDTYTFKVHIGILGSISVQATSKYHAEDKVWIGLQAGKYAPLTAKGFTRKDISVVQIKRDCISSGYTVPFLFKIYAMDGRLLLWMDCKNYCIPLEMIRKINMELQEDICLNGGTRAEASREATLFQEAVSAKLN